MSGDYQGLEDLRKRIAGLATRDTAKRINIIIGVAALTEVQQGFLHSEDPYGKAWAPLKRRNGQPLLDTARMRNSFTYEADQTGFKLGTNVWYAGIHQQGWSGTYERKARTQNMFRRAVGKAKGQFAKNKARGPRVTSQAINFGARQIHMTIPQRMMVPEGTLGPKWTSALNDAANEAFARIFGGK